MKESTTYNECIVSSEVLGQVAFTLNNNLPVTPVFLHGLGTLVEAVVLHNQIWFDVDSGWTDSEALVDDKPTIAHVLKESEFVNSLVKNNVLKSPDKEVIEAVFVNHPDYKFHDFVTDHKWRMRTHIQGSPYHERVSLEGTCDLCYLIPNALKTYDFFNEFGEENNNSNTVSDLHMYDFPDEDILDIEGFNRRERAYAMLSKELNVSYYGLLSAIPHQIEFIKDVNWKSKKVLNKVSEYVNNIDETNTNFQNLQIPPLLLILLNRIKDSKKGLAHELLQMRHEFRGFRKYLTQYEKEFETAKTKKDLLKLNTDFDNAWKQLVERYERPKKRIIYHLWEVLRKPTNILKEIGDKLSKEGQELSVVDKVNGLHDFTDALLGAPTNKEGIILLNKAFQVADDEKLWKHSSQLISYLEKEIQSH